MAILEHLRLILEHSHNAYMFQVQCNHYKIIIQKLPDNSIMAYRADDRDDNSEIDTTLPLFNKISKLLNLQ
jgi:hypothetical protein